MPQSTTKSPVAKPPKPYVGYPLFAHASGRWAKKILGKFHYFGKWTDEPDGGSMAALGRYEEVASDLHAGREPRRSPDGAATVADVCNEYMAAKEHALNAGEIVDRTFAEQHKACGYVCRQLGKRRAVEGLTASDFREMRAEMGERLGPVTLGVWVQRVRAIFRFAYDEGLIDKPVRYGQAFSPPPAKLMRQKRAEAGLKMFSPEEIHKLLEAASVPMRAMVLLGANCGFGNADIGRLPLTALDLEDRWVNYARGKTGVGRRCALWPETVSALKEAIAQRPKPKDEKAAELVFLLENGTSWFKDQQDPLGRKFGALRRQVGMFRRGCAFYALRHGFETVAGESIDQVAVNAVMGHVDSSMAGRYREKISDSRLRAVSDHVRAWLWPPEDGDGEA